MKEISEFITNHPDIIRFKDQILAGIVEARACFLDDLAVGIKKEFEDNNSGFRVKFLPNHNGQKFGENGNAQLIVTPPDNSELTKAPFKIFVEYDDGDYDGALLVGIVTETWFKWCCHPDTPNPSKEEFQAKMSDADQSLFGRMRKVLSEKGKDYSSNPIEPDNFHNWPIGWDCLIEGICDDEGLASLLKVSLAENIAKVCDGIRKHIELLEKVYKEAKAMQLNAIQP